MKIINYKTTIAIFIATFFFFGSIATISKAQAPVEQQRDITTEAYRGGSDQAIQNVIDVKNYELDTIGKIEDSVNALYDVAITNAQNRYATSSQSAKTIYNIALKKARLEYESTLAGARGANREANEAFETSMQRSIDTYKILRDAIYRKSEELKKKNIRQAQTNPETALKALAARRVSQEAYREGMDKAVESYQKEKEEVLAAYEIVKNDYLKKATEIYQREIVDINKARGEAEEAYENAKIDVEDAYDIARKKIAERYENALKGAQDSYIDRLRNLEKEFGIVKR